MAQISKQGLSVDNGISFPNNNSGQITPTALRNFNTNMIDSLVDENTYRPFTASVTSSLINLNAFTASQQPTFNALNAFTASQLTINTGYNNATSSLNTSVSVLQSQTSQLSTFTGSINQIISANVLQGLATRFNFGGLISASITANVGGNIADISVNSDPTKLNTASFNSYTASIAGINAFTASQISFNNSATASISELLSFSSSLDATYATDAQLAAVSSSLNNNINTKLSTSSFNAFTQSVAGGATTGSNTFTGDQTLIDSAGNFYTISDASGSMLLVAKSYTSASAHLSSSVNQVNLIFKNNSNTADTIISGSGNMFINPAAPTTGFKRYVGGSGNIALNGSNVAQISSSMAFSPTMNNNYFGGNSVGLTMRGPVSASSWTISANNVLGTINIGSSAALNAEKLTGVLNMTGNSILGGTFTIVANQSFLTGSTTNLTNNIIGGTTTLNLSSSTAALANNIINDSGFIFTNQFYSSSLGLGTVAFNRNNIGGQSNTITISGSLPAGTTTANSISDNFIFGGSNTIYIDVANARVSGTTAYINAIRNGLMGNQLIVSGSSLSSDQSSVGSVFVGRYNANDTIRNKTSDVVFAVGTGNTTTRKTGFLIDSGSNSYFEGTINISGSVLGNITALTITSNTASMDLSKGNFFTLTLVSGSSTQLTATNIKAGQTVNLLITQANPASGSLTYDSTIKFPAGNGYVATAASASKDIITFITFDNSTIYAAAINNLV